MHYLQIITLGIVFSLLPWVCPADEFPCRKDYPNVPIIELTDLKSGYDKGEFLIVDVRSKLEFDTIHPKNAVHIPMSNAQFEKNVEALAAQNPRRKIVMYCNGVTCLKSYIAVERSMEAGISDVYAFDAGIPAWADSYPSDTVLLGREITNPGKQLISHDEFRKFCLDYEVFKQKAAEDNTIVVDTRDAIQRTRELPGLNDVRQIPLDKFIKNVVNRGVMKEKSFLIFDQVGEQVRWLMYHIANQGYAEFYFLQGGATAVLKEQEYRGAGWKENQLSRKDMPQDRTGKVEPKLVAARSNKPSLATVIGNGGF